MVYIGISKRNGEETESTLLGGIYQENVAMTALVALSIDRRSSDFCSHNTR